MIIKVKPRVQRQLESRKPWSVTGLQHRMTVAPAERTLLFRRTQERLGIASIIVTMAMCSGAPPLFEASYKIRMLSVIPIS